VSDAATLFDADAAAFTGTVEVLGVIFSAEEDGYAVLEVQDEAGEGFALVGPVAHLNEGDRAEVSGDWQTHSRYGRQLKARGALPLDPADRAGRIAYLTSLRHIGPARAERLVD
jgi:exodeoxyribonuclease V alpha subunit